MSSLKKFQNIRLCLILRSKEELDFYAGQLKSLGLNNYKLFEDPETAYQVIRKERFDIFLIRHELDAMPGIVLAQKIRHLKNYGEEIQLFLIDKNDEKLKPTLTDHDIEYILTKPFTVPLFEDKMAYMINKESQRSPQETTYLQARKFLKNKEFDRALEVSQELIDNFNSVEKYLLLHGEILLTHKKYDTAKKFFQEAIAQFPDSVLASYRMAKAYDNLENYDKALKIYRNILKENPFHIKMHEDAGLCYFRSGQLDFAQKIMEYLKTIDKFNKVSSETLAKISLEKGQFEDIKTHLQSTHTTLEIVSYLNNYGIELSKNKRYKEAYKMYASCMHLIENNPHSYIVFYNIGLNFNREKKLKEAKKYLKITLEKKPDFIKAKKLLAKIDKKLSP